MQGTLDKIKSLHSSNLIPFLVPLFIITLITIVISSTLSEKSMENSSMRVLAITSVIISVVIAMNNGEMNTVIISLFAFIFITYLSLTYFYSINTGKFRSKPDSINQLLTLRRTQVGTNIDPLPPNNTSVALAIMNKKSPYVSPKITSSNISLLQWSPLTVRLAGYLGGNTDASNGVFDMLKATQVALSLGARSFVFDIDFLDAKPCEPRLIYRDSGGVMRSLHTASIHDGMDSLNNMAFKENYDPVIIVLYLRRIPAGKSQKEAYFSAIATSLHPLSTHHLGLTEQGNFHGCNNEKVLFFGDITQYQKKFIVLCNYDTTLLQRASNPKDSLNFWINARLYLHEASTSSTLGSVTKKVGTGGIAYAKVGDINDFLTIPGSSTTAVDDFQQGSIVTYTIALPPIDYNITTGKINILLNTLGVHSIPLDVIRLGEHTNHNETIKKMKPSGNITMADITTATNGNDPLSFWTYAGWARFKTDDKANNASAADPSK